VAVGAHAMGNYGRTSLYLLGDFGDRRAVMLSSRPISGGLQHVCVRPSGASVRRSVCLRACRSGLQAQHLFHSDVEAGKPEQNLSQRRSTHNRVLATFTAHSVYASEICRSSGT
jgi:hypothetical protein